MISVSPVVTGVVVMGSTPQVGQNAKLQCIATPGNPTAMTYSWYRENVLVSGPSTDATLPFNPVSNDNGKTYECRVDNGFIATGSLVLNVNSKSFALILQHVACVLFSVQESKCRETKTSRDNILIFSFEYSRLGCFKH